MWNPDICMYKCVYSVIPINKLNTANVYLFAWHLFSLWENYLFIFLQSFFNVRALHRQYKLFEMTNEKNKKYGFMVRTKKVLHTYTLLKDIHIIAFSASQKQNFFFLLIIQLISLFDNLPEIYMELFST